MNLIRLGWDDQWQAAWDAIQSEYPDSEPARVVQSGGARIVKILGRSGKVQDTPVAGKLLNASDETYSFPVTGDWVIVEAAQDMNKARITHILPRRTKFSRKRPGKKLAEQVVAANVDLLMIAMAIGRDFNLNRLERYFAQAQLEGVKAIFVVTKIDLAEDDISFYREELAKVSKQASVIVTSTWKGIGKTELFRELMPGKTAVIVGSSGVGKSSLINFLSNSELIKTAEINEQAGRGRHTTTRRELVVLENGSMLLDTPGMREFGLWITTGQEDVTFEQNGEGGYCRFSNCSHSNEEGCAVRGNVDMQRKVNQEKIISEAKFVWVKGRRIERKKLEFGKKASSLKKQWRSREKGLDDEDEDD